MNPFFVAIASSLLPIACGDGTEQIEDPCDGAPDGAELCSEPGEICFEGSCEVGCFIDGTFHADGETATGSGCLVCRLEERTGDWTHDCPSGQACYEGECVDDLTFETLDVFLDGDGAGSVISSPEGIDCGTECRFEYERGETVTLTAIAATGSTFVDWSGDCSASFQHGESVTLTAHSNDASTFTGWSDGLAVRCVR